MNQTMFLTNCRLCWESVGISPPSCVQKMESLEERWRRETKTRIFTPVKISDMHYIINSNNNKRKCSIASSTESEEVDLKRCKSETEEDTALNNRHLSASLLNEDTNLVSHSTSSSLQYDAVTVDNARHKREVEKARYERNIKLYQFLIDLLEDKDPCVMWITRENGVFKIVDSDKFARLWGEVKLNPTMNYEKLARSFRHYYKKGILESDSTISKTGKRKLYYKFSTDMVKQYLKQ